MRYTSQIGYANSIPPAPSTESVPLPLSLYTHARESAYVHYPRIGLPVESRVSTRLDRAEPSRAEPSAASSVARPPGQPATVRLAWRLAAGGLVCITQSALPAQRQYPEITSHASFRSCTGCLPRPKAVSFSGKKGRHCLRPLMEGVRDREPNTMSR